MAHQKYLVGYITMDRGRIGMGRIEVTRDAPVKTAADVEDVERFLRKHKSESSLLIVGMVPVER